MKHVVVIHRLIPQQTVHVSDLSWKIYTDVLYILSVVFMQKLGLYTILYLKMYDLNSDNRL